VTKKKLHILFVASWYPNRNQPVLGNFIQRHAKAVALNHQVSVVAAFSDAHETGLIEHHHPNLSEYVMHYPKVKDGDKILSVVRKVKAYRDAVGDTIQKAIARNGKPDVLHVHVAWPAALAVVPLAKQLGVPIILTEHWSGYLPEDGNYRGFFLKHYTKNLFGKSKAVTVVSDHMKNAMRNHGLRGNFSNLPNAANTEVFHFAQKPNEADRPFRFLHVSMLVDREKNITGLLTAFAAASKLRPMELTIIGDGPERSKHEETARKLKIEKCVSFAGIKIPVEIAEYMNTHDALVMFSHFEGMPVTIIEAQCCGMPVLATNTGAIREMLTNAKDIIVTPGDTDQLSKAMQVMAANMGEEKNVEELRRGISKKACAHYSYETVGAKLNSIYRDVLSKP